MPKNTPLPGTEHLTRQQRVKLAGLRYELKKAVQVREGYLSGAVTAARLQTADRYVEAARSRLHAAEARLGVPTTRETD